MLPEYEVAGLPVHGSDGGGLLHGVGHGEGGRDGQGGQELGREKGANVRKKTFTSIKYDHTRQEDNVLPGGLVDGEEVPLALCQHERP